MDPHTIHTIGSNLRDLSIKISSIYHCIHHCSSSQNYYPNHPLSEYMQRPSRREHLQTEIEYVFIVVTNNKNGWKIEKDRTFVDIYVFPFETVQVFVWSDVCPHVYEREREREREEKGERRRKIKRERERDGERKREKV